MGAYKNEGNDPTRKRVTQSPEEVKAMLMSGASAPGAVDNMEDLVGEAIGGGFRSDKPLVEELDGVTHVEFRHHNRIYSGPTRCLTCGRAFDCCCANCEYCVVGKPKREVS